MEENRTDDTQKVKRSFSAWLGELREFMKGRFSLDEDKAQRDEVVASVSKGVEFRGVNLWVLIFATMIASLGLNVNSAAVIIGAMLISPIMGPIMGVGLALGINDFELLKKSLRNLALMFIVAIITSTVYFFISPLSSNSSELLARTVPTTYDVLIALFGGLAGIVAQTRQDRTSTVIPGVAIATALIPPLCTAVAEKWLGLRGSSAFSSAPSTSSSSIRCSSRWRPMPWCVFCNTRRRSSSTRSASARSSG